MRRYNFLPILCGIVLTVSVSLAADSPKKPHEMTVPFNAEVRTKSPVTFTGVLNLTPPVTINVSPGSTMQLGQGSSIALNGPVTLGGTFVLNGTITIPKGAILSESQAPLVHPQSGPAHQVTDQPSNL